MQRVVGRSSWFRDSLPHTINHEKDLLESGVKSNFHGLFAYLKCGQSVNGRLELEMQLLSESMSC